MRYLDECQLQRPRTRIQHILVSIVSPQPIIDVEDVVIILIIIPVIMCRLAWLGKHAPGVVRRLISKRWVANMERLDNICGQL